MINSRLKQLFTIIIAAILVFSQSGFTGLSTAYAAALENAVVISAIESDGTTVLEPTAIEFSKDDTALDMLKEATDNVKTEVYDWGEMIVGINGVGLDDDDKYWAFYINGISQPLGADSTVVNHGDHIQFIYDGFSLEELEVTVSAVDGNGKSVIEKETIKLPEHTTAYDALVNVASNQKVEVDVGVDSEYFIFLNYLVEPLQNECEFWSTSMNGEPMYVGLLGHAIQDGDFLELSVENWCGDDENDNEDEDETNEPPAEDKNDEEEPKQVDFDKALELVTQYLTTNTNQLDWYGFAALNSLDVAIDDKMAADVASSIDEDVTGRATDFAKNIIILTSAGYDATDINGVNLVERLMNESMPTSNFLIYSLLAIDSANYEIPDGTTWTRESIIDEIIKLELDAGGWSFFGNDPSPDITGMALLALSPYVDQEHVKQAIDRAVQVMSSKQGDKGGFDISMNGGYTSEAAAMMVVGLSALGIDSTDELFTKSEGNLLEHLLTFQMEDGSFKHLAEDTRSSTFATNQAALALVAYDKFKNGEGPVFKYELDKEKEEDKHDGKDEEKPGQPNHPTLTKDNISEYETTDAIIVTLNEESQLTVKNDALEYMVQVNKPLIVSNNEAKITIPVELLKQFLELGETLEVHLIEQQVDKAVGAVYDFILKVDGKVISKFDGEITVELAVNPDKVSNIDPEHIKAFYYNEETEEWEVILDSQYDSDTGFVAFTTTHLSVFGLFEYDHVKKQGDDKNQEEDSDSNHPQTNDKNTKGDGKPLPKTATNTFNIILIGLILGLAGTVLFIIQRRKVME